MNEDPSQPQQIPGRTAQLEKDPVCGMKVNPATTKHIHERAGKKYYFCCGHCVEKFKSDPEGYLSKPAAVGLVTLGMPAPEKTNPAAEFVRDPVCGMNVNPSASKL